MTALIQPLKDSFGRSLCNIFRNVQKIYEDIVNDVKLKIQADLIDRWENMETPVQAKSALLAASAGDELIRRF